MRLDDAAAGAGAGADAASSAAAAAAVAVTVPVPVAPEIEAADETANGAVTGAGLGPVPVPVPFPAELLLGPALAPVSAVLLAAQPHQFVVPAYAPSYLMLSHPASTIRAPADAGNQRTGRILRWTACLPRQLAHAKSLARALGACTARTQ